MNPISILLDSYNIINESFGSGSYYANSSYRFNGFDGNVYFTRFSTSGNFLGNTYFDCQNELMLGATYPEVWSDPSFSAIFSVGSIQYGYSNGALINIANNLTTQISSIASLTDRYQLSISSANGWFAGTGVNSQGEDVIFWASEITGNYSDLEVSGNFGLLENYDLFNSELAALDGVSFYIDSVSAVSDDGRYLLVSGSREEIFIDPTDGIGYANFASDLLRFDTQTGQFLDVGRNWWSEMDWYWQNLDAFPNVSGVVGGDMSRDGNIVAFGIGNGIEINLIEFETSFYISFNDIYDLNNTQLYNYSFGLSADGFTIVVENFDNGLLVSFDWRDLVGLLGSASDDNLATITAGSVYGFQGNDILAGNSGLDALFGGMGNDTLIGGAGADQLDGGSGIDVADYSASAMSVLVNLYYGVGIGGDAQGDVILDVENVRGSAFNDIIRGTTGTNVLDGGHGVDQLLGDVGNDVLNGGVGADHLDGGFGWDTADFTSSAGGVQVNLFHGVGLYNDAAGDTYAAIENVWGSSHNDIIRGTIGANILEGRGGGDFLLGDAGHDILRGGAGNDILRGGFGADHIDGGSGFDVADYTDSNARVLINLFYGNALEGHAQGDTFTGVESVFGSAFNDIIRGTAGANALRGNGGADILTGDGGADLFQYSNTSWGNDLITDFADGVDMLDLRGSGLAFGSLTISTIGGDTFVSITGSHGSAIKLDNFIGTLNAADFIF